MFKVTFFLISMATNSGAAQQEIVLHGSETYTNLESCNAAAAFVAENSPAGYTTTWECNVYLASN